ncbi:MAG: flagellar biosynthetic protein FliR [Thermodesulfobacteriota bacterium]
MNNPLVITGYFSNFLIIFIRLGMVVFLLPFWSGKQFPRQFKIGFALAAAYVLAPVIRVETGNQTILSILVQEMILGALLGLAARILFLGVELAGTFISDAMGISMATVFNPEMGQSTEVSTILGLLAMLLFLALDLHHDLLALLIKSYQVLPVGRLRGDNLMLKGIQLGSQVFVLAIKLAAPVLVGMIVVNVLMGFIYKAAPQVNIFFVSLPVYLLVGFIILILSLPLLVNFLGSRFEGLTEEFNRILTLAKG